MAQVPVPKWRWCGVTRGGTLPRTANLRAPSTAAVHFTPYATRSVRPLGTHDVDGVRLKVYSITLRDGPPDAMVCDAALEVARRHLRLAAPLPTVAGIDWSQAPRCDVGTLIVHLGKDAIYLLLDRWIEECMLEHHVWIAPLHEPTQFASFDATGLAMCVWELAVLQHERQAWITHVLMRADAPDFDGYLADTLHADL